MPSLVGTQLGQYQILEEIGRGGMAVVYKAYQPSLNRYVAIKVLLPHLSQDRDFIERFQREALAAGKLEHPNIIHIYDVGQEGDLHYLVMPYVAGPSLAARLAQEGALDLRTAVSIVRQVGAALDFAHSQGVVHRDVKPSNILLTSTGQAILSDFGIARAASESRLTQTGAPIGTPAYMSPEQAEGEPVDGRADLYSLGTVLYEMLTGQVPFQADTPTAVLYKQVHERPPSLSGTNTAVPKAVERVVLQALEKDKNKRYQRAGEMVDALTRAVTTQTPVPVKRQIGYKTVLPLVVLAILAATIVPRILPSKEHGGTPAATPLVVVAVSATPTLKPTVAPTATRLPPTTRPSSTLTKIPTATPTPTVTPSRAPTRTRMAKPSPTPVKEIIVDDADGGFSTAYSQDPWQVYEYVGGQDFGSTHRYNRQIGSGQDTATWTFTIPQPGRYQVYAWWFDGSWRPGNVPYTVHHRSGTTTIRVNQQTNGGRWNLLGEFAFDAQGSVVVSDDVSSGRDVVADAIRLVYVAPLARAAPPLMKGPGRPIYLVEDGVRRWFPNTATFDAMGYKAGQVTEVTWADLSTYPAGEPLPILASTLEEGALVKGTSKAVYLIEGGRKRFITDWSVFLAHGFKEVDIAQVTDRWLDGIEDGPVLSD